MELITLKHSIENLPLIDKIDLIEQILNSIKAESFSFPKTNQNISKEILLNSEIDKGNKSLNPKELIGIWENLDIDIEKIRSANWNRQSSNLKFQN